jgi:hypothetical protein
MSLQKFSFNSSNEIVLSCISCSSVNLPNNSEAVSADWHVCKCLLTFRKVQVHITRFSLKRKRTVQKINKKMPPRGLRNLDWYSITFLSWLALLNALPDGEYATTLQSESDAFRYKSCKKIETLSTITSYRHHNYHLTTFKYVAQHYTQHPSTSNCTIYQIWIRFEIMQNFQ